MKAIVSTKKFKIATEIGFKFCSSDHLVSFGPQNSITKLLLSYLKQAKFLLANVLQIPLGPSHVFYLNLLMNYELVKRLKACAS